MPRDLMAKPIYAADSIGKRFGESVILKSASVWAWPGAISVVFGRNGSGKSTLLRIGTGLLRGDHGAVTFRGISYVRPRLHVLARGGLYYLPDRSSLPFGGTLRRCLHQIQQRFHATLDLAVVEMLGLGPLIDSPFIELSGGEMKRVEVAIACARQPRCLLADEPFAGISPRDGEQLATALEYLRGQGSAIIVTGHEVPQLLDIADEVVWMTAGTTHGLGSAAKAVENEQFTREYLGPRNAPASRREGRMPTRIL